MQRTASSHSALWYIFSYRCFLLLKADRQRLAKFLFPSCSSVLFFWQLNIYIFPTSSQLPVKLQTRSPVFEATPPLPRPLVSDTALAASSSSIRFPTTARHYTGILFIFRCFVQSTSFHHISQGFRLRIYETKHCLFSLWINQRCISIYLHLYIFQLQRMLSIFMPWREKIKQSWRGEHPLWESSYLLSITSSWPKIVQWCHVALGPTSALTLLISYVIQTADAQEEAHRR